MAAHAFAEMYYNSVMNLFHLFWLYLWRSLRLFGKLRYVFKVAVLSMPTYFRRPNNVGSKTDVSLVERQHLQAHHHHPQQPPQPQQAPQHHAPPQPPQPPQQQYDHRTQSQIFVEQNMNEVSKSISSIKLNNVNNPQWNYKIISINKDHKTNQHSIRIGIDDAIKKDGDDTDDTENVGGSSSDSDSNRTTTPPRIPYQINPTTCPSIAQNKITVKMMPNSQNTATKLTKSSARKYSTEDVTLVSPSPTASPSPTEENVDLDVQCQSVSSARALFERMSSSSDRLKNTKEKPQLKSWNSSTLLDDRESDRTQTNFTTTVKTTKPIHEHSKSLPVDISAREYEKHIQHSRQTSGLVGDTVTTNRPKYDFRRGQSSDSNVNNSNSNIANNNNSNNNNNRVHVYQHASSGSEIIPSNIDTNLRDQMSALPSYSSEDLRYKEEVRARTSTTGSKNDSANELRLAASRYHEELMKNYPKFRNTITGKDNVLKFTTRKTSAPTAEEPFTRGNMRATIATTTQRSYSASDTLEIQDLNEVLSKTSEDSMMQRLLRDHSNSNNINSNNNNLMKIDEEVKASGNVRLAHRSNSCDALEQRGTDSHRRTSSRSSSSESPTTPDERLTEQQRGRFAGTKSTSSIVPGGKSISIQTEEKKFSSNHSFNGVQQQQQPLAPKSPSSLVTTINDETRSKDADDDDVNQESDTMIPPGERVRHTDIDSKQTAVESPVPLESTPTPPPYAVETDIDAVEVSDIVHCKYLSTDSACDEPAQISHEKGLSNISTDSLQDYSDLSYKQYDNDILTYDYQGEDSNEKEKSQRKTTINRRKKDSSLANSRHGSCVSTDSTNTIDSGIVVLSESQRASPMSNYSSDYKDLNGSRETLDEDVAALEGDSRLMSTPERHEEAKSAGYQLLGKSYDRSLTQSPSLLSSGENSRRDSMHSPRPGDLDNEKAKLVGSMREKISELREQEQEIADEIKMNEELGKKVKDMVKVKANQTEFSKFDLFIGELNKIVALLLSLTQRLHRHELTLLDLDMTNDADREKKESLKAKIDKLKEQHEEACHLRDVNDKRGETVSLFLEKYCTEEEFADFQYYVDMKSQLALMQSEIREKVKLGEERLKALELTNSEWSYK